MRRHRGLSETCRCTGQHLGSGDISSSSLSRYKEWHDRTSERLQEDPRHPSLHFGRVGNYWSVRVGRGYRALAIQDGDDFIWFWVGDHDEYMRII